MKESISAIVAIGFLGCLIAFAGVSSARSPMPEPGAVERLEFAVGTDRRVRSVEVRDPSTLNAELALAAQRGESWIHAPALVALRLVGDQLEGNGQVVRVSHVYPRERNGGPIVSARVVVENTGFLDDSIAGDRAVVGLTAVEEGGLRVTQYLFALQCARPEPHYATTCP